MKKLALLLAVALIMVLALSVTVGAWGTPTDCIPGDGNLDGSVTSADKTAVRYMTQGWWVDLTVTSEGCCNITVAPSMSSGGTVLAGETETFWNLWYVETVTLTADDSAAGCDFDGWSDGAVGNPNPHVINMALGVDADITGYCCVAPVPEPCCWCIYAVDWWVVADPGDPKPVGDPTHREYFCLHTEFEYPPMHYEFLGWDHWIPDPSYHQEAVFYAGNETPPNGYGLPEWAALNMDPGPPGPDPRVERLNSALGPVYAYGLAYWGSKCDLTNWKGRYNLYIPGIGGDATIYSSIVGQSALVGNAGWPYAVGNQWASCNFAPPVVPAPKWSMTIVTGTETIYPPAFPGGILCYVVESWEMAGDPPGFTPVKMTSKNWYSNDYGCTIVRENYPGDLYQGYEDMHMVWYCQDPPPEDFPFDPELPEWILPH